MDWSHFSSYHQGTPLHLAAKGGRFDTVKYLDEKGANIHSEDSDRVSVWECTCGSMQLVVKLFVSYLRCSVCEKLQNILSHFQ